MPGLILHSETKKDWPTIKIKAHNIKNASTEFFQIIVMKRNFLRNNNFHYGKFQYLKIKATKSSR